VVVVYVSGKAEVRHENEAHQKANVAVNFPVVNYMKKIDDVIQAGQIQLAIEARHFLVNLENKLNVTAGGTHDQMMDPQRSYCWCANTKETIYLLNC